MATQSLIWSIASARLATRCSRPWSGARPEMTSRQSVPGSDAFWHSVRDSPAPRPPWNPARGLAPRRNWIARAVSPDGTVVLTDRADDLLDDARDFFERVGLAARAVLECGDAVEIAPRGTGRSGPPRSRHRPRRRRVRDRPPARAPGRRSSGTTCSPTATSGHPREPSLYSMVKTPRTSEWLPARPSSNVSRTI